MRGGGLRDEIRRRADGTRRIERHRAASETTHRGAHGVRTGDATERPGRQRRDAARVGRHRRRQHRAAAGEHREHDTHTAHRITTGVRHLHTRRRGDSGPRRCRLRRHRIRRNRRRRTDGCRRRERHRTAGQSCCRRRQRIRSRARTKRPRRQRRDTTRVRHDRRGTRRTDRAYARRDSKDDADAADAIANGIRHLHAGRRGHRGADRRRLRRHGVRDDCRGSTDRSRRIERHRAASETTHRGAHGVRTGDATERPGRQRRDAARVGRHRRRQHRAAAGEHREHDTHTAHRITTGVRHLHTRRRGDSGPRRCRLRRHRIRRNRRRRADGSGRRKRDRAARQSRRCRRNRIGARTRADGPCGQRRNAARVRHDCRWRRRRHRAAARRQREDHARATDTVAVRVRHFHTRRRRDGATYGCRLRGQRVRDQRRRHTRRACRTECHGAARQSGHCRGDGVDAGRRPERPTRQRGDAARVRRDGCRADRTQHTTAGRHREYHADAADGIASRVSHAHARRRTRGTTRRRALRRQGVRGNGRRRADGTGRIECDWTTG